MKKTVLSLLMLLPFGYIHAEHKKIVYQAIVSPVLKFIDGTNRLNLIKIIQFRKWLRELHWINPQIEFDGKLHTIKQLTDLESNLSPEEFKYAFAKAIEKFAEVAVPYMQDAAGSEDYIKELVKQWSVQRNRPQSSLLEWSELTSHAQAVFYKNIKTFRDLNQFLEDLEIFLGDFIQSCPKSLEQIKNASKPH